MRFLAEPGLINGQQHRAALWCTQLRRRRQRFTQVGSSASNGGKECHGQKKKCSQRKNALHGPAAYMNFSIPACLDEKAAVWDGSRNANAPDFSVSLISVG